MSLFMSRRQRQLQRDQDVRKGIQTIRRNLRALEKNMRDYRLKAVRAKQIGAEDQLRVLRDAIGRSLSQMRLQERQLLAVETAQQMKNQAEAMQQFASSMAAVSKSIASAFGGTDMDQVMNNYERAMSQAQDMEERMNVFLDMSADMMGGEGSADELVTAGEIDRLIEEDLQMAESRKLDDRIDEALRRAERSTS